MAVLAPAAQATPLDPFAYSSLGNLTLTAGQSLAIDTTSLILRIDGVQTAVGTTQTQAGGAPTIAVFDFNLLNLPAGVVVNITADPGVR